MTKNKQFGLRFRKVLALSCLLEVFISVSVTTSAVAQQPAVSVEVDAGASQGELRPVWSFFGYDEPNYTYAPNGEKLLKELRALAHRRFRSTFGFTTC